MSNRNKHLLLSVIFAISLVAGCGYARKLSKLKLQNNPEHWLDADGIDKLEEFGFVLSTTPYEEIYDAYHGYSKSTSRPMFVTADVPLHTLHLLVDYSVRILEAEELLPRLQELTAGMFESAVKDYESMSPELADAAHAELIYFAVASRLLGLEIELSAEDMVLVEEELVNIDNHVGFDTVEFLPPSPPIIEDYSQYVPRGHYTRSDDFKRYFKAMMWFGRLPLHLPKEDTSSLVPMQAALLLSLNLAGDDRLASLWQEIYQPTSFFFGQAEDLTPEQIIADAQAFYGSDLDPEMLADEAMLRRFADSLREKHKPRILSEFLIVDEGDRKLKVPLSLRFMPQRFIPDSYMFSQLVFNQVYSYQGPTSIQPFTWGMTDYGPMRVLPRGLDIMAVLGWEKAADILKDDIDTDYQGYGEQFDKMVNWYNELGTEELESSVYFRWFDLFTAYRQATPPPLADATAWERKKLITALGSWTELRHDAILYAKQSYTPATKSAAPPPPLRLAAVEEAPLLYRKIAYCSRTIAGFSQDTEDHHIKRTFLEFADLLDRMADLSDKQAKAQNLTAQEHAWLWNLSSTMGYLPHQLGDVITSDEDVSMALIADVHTDANTGNVLEEATGNPAALYVLVKIDGKAYVAQGATFTYYEFSQPMSHRLTDGEWQEMVKQGSSSATLPSWTEVLF